MIAGMRYLGQWEARAEQVISCLAEIKGTLFVESLWELTTSGGEAASSVAAFFAPYIARGEMRLVAEATPAELDACRRSLPSLVGLFQIVMVPAFSKDQAIGVLERATDSFKANYHIQASAEVPALICRLLERFLPYEVFPGRSMGLLRRAFERAKQDRAEMVAAGTIIKLFVEQTGLPEVFLSDDIPLGFDSVDKTFREQVVGQPAACREAASVVTAFKAGLNDPARPLAVLLFCGPTGVGKTQMAKSISSFLYGHGTDQDRLVRLDMSEYSSGGAAQRLNTSPSGEPSQLIKKLRQQPFSLVLFDEIEKAAPEVFDVLLSVFDEGRLTDRHGRTTTFKSAVIVMTSNLGADKSGPPGFEADSSGAYAREVKAFFRPEFFNRLDAVVRFDQLDQDSILEITRKELDAVALREGLRSSGITLSWTERLVRHLAELGYEPRYGARPLQRTIESLVVVPLAGYLVQNPALRSTGIEIDVESGVVSIHLVKP